MNIAALRAVPRRSWWTLAVVTLIVCAFAFDRDLGVTVVVCRAGAREYSPIVRQAVVLDRARAANVVRASERSWHEYSFGAR